MFLKNFFYYSRKERRGIFLLLVLLALAFFVQNRLLYLEERQQDHALETDSLWLASYAAFCESLQHEEQPVTRHSPPTPRKLRKPEYAVFDPNRADSSEFIRMGLSPFVVRNILRYRAKGGTFKEKESFARIYGLSRNEFEAIRPYLQIEAAPSKKQPFPTSATDTSTARKNSHKPPKYPAGTLLDLNTADTASLKRIPGIGPFRARCILDYRNRTGGFYDVSQLREIPNFPDSLMKWFRIETPPERVLRINRMSAERLASHPYLNFYQARVIVAHRRKHGHLHSLKPLSLYEEFKPADFERLAPYVRFE